MTRDRILIVGDDDAVREGHAVWLEREGYDAHSVDMAAEDAVRVS